MPGGPVEGRSTSRSCGLSTKRRHAPSSPATHPRSTSQPSMLGWLVERGCVAGEDGACLLLVESPHERDVDLPSTGPPGIDHPREKRPAVSDLGGLLERPLDVDLEPDRP